MSHSRVLSAKDALRAAKAMQAHEREALREAGKKKLDEYRKLKAAVMTDIEYKLSTFSSTTASPAAASPAGSVTQEPQQASAAGSNSAGSDVTDPMVDVLLGQVSVLMADKQRLTAQCSSLRRENEQLVELVGYLSLEQQQLLEQQQSATSDDSELDGVWHPTELEQQLLLEDVDDDVAPMHTSSESSMDAAFVVCEDESSVQVLH